MFSSSVLQSRRDFLKGLGYGVGSAAMLSTAEMLCRTNAYAGGPSGYKALVCIFMFGGNDSNNMVIPYVNEGGTGGYARYNGERPPATQVNIPNGTNPINPKPDAGGVVYSAGAFGMHTAFGNVPAFGTGPVIPGFAARFNADKAAIVKNVGSLIQPAQSTTTPSANPRTVYLNPGAHGYTRPAQLFSHSDQQSEYQTGIFNTTGATGWGGRTAQNTLTFNSRPGNIPGLRFPMISSIAGTQPFGIATNPNVRQLVVPDSGNGAQSLANLLVLNGYGPLADGGGNPTDEGVRRAVFDYLRTIDRGHSHVRAYQDIMQTAVDVVNSLGAAGNVNVNPPAGTTSGVTPFPAQGYNNNSAIAGSNTGIGRQLAQVARLIVANKTQAALGLNRQIFFCSLGGFDTHGTQGGAAGAQFNLLRDMNYAMSCFYNWLTNARYNVNGGGILNLGDISSEVTMFTLSDFSRTFNPNGTFGTDHAWGSTQLALGGAVDGRRISGLPVPPSRGGTGGVSEDYIKVGAYDSGNRGQWVPSVGTDQYANTLARWYGLPQTSTVLNEVFPHLQLKGNAPYNQPLFLEFMGP